MESRLQIQARERLLASTSDQWVTDAGRLAMQPQFAFLMRCVSQVL